MYRDPASVQLTPEQWIQMGMTLGFTADQMKQALFSVSLENHSEQISNGFVFTLAVDYSKSKAEMIKDGNYGYVNELLRDNDPVEGKIDGSGIVEATLELIRFNRVISTADALSEIKKRGLVPAGIEHLLALGAKHPNLQKEFPIVALGSVWQSPHGNRCVAYLHRWHDERGLRLSWHDGDWRESYRFLVVGKPST